MSRGVAAFVEGEHADEGEVSHMLFDIAGLVCALRLDALLLLSTGYSSSSC